MDKVKRAKLNTVTTPFTPFGIYLYFTYFTAPLCFFEIYQILCFRQGKIIYIESSGKNLFCFRTLSSFPGFKTRKRCVSHPQSLDPNLEIMALNPVSLAIFLARLHSHLLPSLIQILFISTSG